MIFQNSDSRKLPLFSITLSSSNLGNGVRAIVIRHLIWLLAVFLHCLIVASGYVFLVTCFNSSNHYNLYYTGLISKSPRNYFPKCYSATPLELKFLFKNKNSSEKVFFKIAEINCLFFSKIFFNRFLIEYVCDWATC